MIKKDTFRLGPNIMRVLNLFAKDSGLETDAQGFVESVMSEFLKMKLRSHPARPIIMQLDECRHVEDVAALYLAWRKGLLSQEGFSIAQSGRERKGAIEKFYHIMKGEARYQPQRLKDK